MRGAETLGTLRGPSGGGARAPSRSPVPGGERKGILGLGFDELAVCGFPYEFDCVETPFHRLVDSGALDSPVFSFYLVGPSRFPAAGAAAARAQRSLACLSRRGLLRAT